jgi:hypothetical protein
MHTITAKNLGNSLAALVAGFGTAEANTAASYCATRMPGH